MTGISDQIPNLQNTYLFHHDMSQRKRTGAKIITYKVKLHAIY